MVKNIFFILLLVSALEANRFEANCASCHKLFPVEIDKFLYRYILKYSSEESVKVALAEYLSNPTREKSVMPEPFILRFGIKKPSDLNGTELQNAIDDYWLMYKIEGTLY